MLLFYIVLLLLYGVILYYCCYIVLCCIIVVILCHILLLLLYCEKILACRLYSVFHGWLLTYTHAKMYGSFRNVYLFLCWLLEVEIGSRGDYVSEIVNMGNYCGCMSVYITVCVRVCVCMYEWICDCLLLLLSTQYYLSNYCSVSVRYNKVVRMSC